MTAPIRLAVVALTMAALAATGGWLLFSHFAVFEDESYILLAARGHFQHGQLYTSVYSQYGPAFHVGADLFQAGFGLLTHESARLLTLGLWLGAALAGAGLVARLTRSTALMVATLVATFFHLYLFIDEPFHPGSFAVFLLSAVVLALDGLNARHPRAAAFLAGAGLALLALTKINVGLFFAVTLGTWAALAWSRAPGPRVWLTVTLAVFGLGLFRPLLDQAWVQLYWLQFTIGAGTILAVAAPPPRGMRGQPLACVLGILAAGAMVLGIVWLRGSSPAGLVEGVLLGPLRHPATYSYPVDWRPGTLPLALLSPVLLFAHRWLGRRHSPRHADRLVVGLRLVQAAALLGAFLAIMHLRVVGVVFSYVAPLIWTWVVPLSTPNRDRLGPARLLLALTLLPQYLHAFPIGGSQESWGTVLLLPLVALGLHELHRWLPPTGRRARRWRIAGATALALLFGKVAGEALSAHATYAAREDLALPGAHAIRLPDPARSAYRLLAQNATIHADSLFSLPGIFGLNLWTDLPPPTHRNTTLWFSLLSEADQLATLRALDRDPRAGFVVQQDLLEIMAASGVHPHGPLVAWLATNFRPVFQVEGFRFYVRTGRRIAPLGIARLEDPQTLAVNLLSDGTPIVAIEIRHLAGPPEPATVLTAVDATLRLAPTNRAGDLPRAPESTAWPLRFRGLARVEIQLDRPWPAPPRGLLRFKASDGRVVAEARFSD